MRSRRPVEVQPCGIMPQLPGPPGFPQVWQAVDGATADEAPLVTAANVESFLCSEVLLHCGHRGAASAVRTSFSNSLLHSRHWYS
jgi:hypothetical protein